MIVEIRTYRVRANAADEFVRLMTSQALPLLAEHGIAVLDCGLSLDPDGEPQADAYLIRSFQSLARREAQEAGFYGSDAWTQGPREPVLALIEGFHTIVLELAADTAPAGAAAGLRVGVEQTT